MTTESNRRVVVSAKIKPKYQSALLKLAKRHGESKIGTYIGRVLEELAQGRILCPECKHPHPIHDDSKARLECSRIAVDISRTKADELRKENSPFPNAVACAIEEVGADIEHAIVHGEKK